MQCNESDMYDRVPNRYYRLQMFRLKIYQTSRTWILELDHSQKVQKVLYVLTFYSNSLINENVYIFIYRSTLKLLKQV